MCAHAVAESPPSTTPLPSADGRPSDISASAGATRSTTAPEPEAFVATSCSQANGVSISRTPTGLSAGPTATAVLTESPPTVTEAWASDVTGTPEPAARASSTHVAPRAPEESPVVVAVPSATRSTSRPSPARRRAIATRPERSSARVWSGRRAAATCESVAEPEDATCASTGSREARRLESRTASISRDTRAAASRASEASVTDWRERCSSALDTDRTTSTLATLRSSMATETTTGTTQRNGITPARSMIAKARSRADALGRTGPAPPGLPASAPAALSVPGAACSPASTYDVLMQSLPGP